MIRFITFLLGKIYEPCKSCETLKKQLEFVNAEKRELLDILLSLVNPKILESPATIVQPIQITGGLFSRRRSALEQRDRESAKIEKLSPNIGRADNDSINTASQSTAQELEKELGVV